MHFNSLDKYWWFSSDFIIGQKIDFEADDIEPNLIAGLLKQYLRELPANILTPKLQPVFDALIGKCAFFLLINQWNQSQFDALALMYIDRTSLLESVLLRPLGYVDVANESLLQLL